MSVQFMHGSAIAMFVIKLSQAGILRTTILIGRLIELHIKNLSRQISFPANVTPLNQGRIKGGGHFGQVPGAPRFRGMPRGCLWCHVFRDRTARFWADILYMYRGAGAPHESRTFLCN